VSVQDVVVGVLLAGGVASVLLSCAGLLAMRDPLDRLHFTAPAGTIAPVLFAAAVLVEEPLSSAAVKAVIVAVLIIVTTPSLSHATARAARIREHGRFKLVPHDSQEDEGG
jgi:monovalent cation/proton antiporter MnhG/PhaG subunit